MLKDHYPCVSSLEQVTQLRHETDGLKCCPNAALRQMHLGTETTEEKGRNGAFCVFVLASCVGQELAKCLRIRGGGPFTDTPAAAGAALGVWRTESHAVWLCRLGVCLRQADAAN